MLTELGLLGKIRPAFKQSNSSLAQLVERRTVNPQVAGSSPAGGAKFRKAASLDAAFFVTFFYPILQTFYIPILFI